MAAANALNISQAGYTVFDGTGTFTGRTFQPGTGITLSNASGVSGNTTINATGGGFTWTDITGATQALVVQNGYVTDRGGGVTYTLPATAAFGEMIWVAGKLGLWTIAQNALQQILVGSASSTIGITGSLTATNVGDCVLLLCTTGGTSTVWRALNTVGNITIA
jgi:hypothetical protein